MKFELEALLVFGKLARDLRKLGLPFEARQYFDLEWSLMTAEPCRYTNYDLLAVFRF